MNNVVDCNQALLSRIKQEINSSGPISFARYMELALYSPGLGYYSAGLPKFGRGGDFTTAPEISVLYSHAIAKQCQEILNQCPGDILELGAGSGAMALEILLELERQNSLPNHYYILEISADLKLRQQELIKQKAPHLLSRLKWLDTLTNFQINGVILANEVIDAFPVHRFKFSKGQLQELYIKDARDEFIEQWLAPSANLKNYINSLDIKWPEDYESECNLSIDGWIKSLSEVLTQGVILIIDYGFHRSEYYHPERNDGTLMCHHRHQAHSNSLINIGLQDITAHVDFTAVAEAAVKSQLEIAGYTNQASFLLACGIMHDLQKHPRESHLELANQIKVLTSPNQMGELFKIMALSKNYDHSMMGFLLRDSSERL